MRADRSGLRELRICDTGGHLMGELIHKPSQGQNDSSLLRIGAPEIVRAHLLDAIDDQVCSGHHALVVEGESGDGKSVLVHAYARRHPDRAVYVTVSAASKWGYDPDCVLQSIGTEIHRLIDGPPSGPDHVFQESDLQSLYNRLRRRGSTSKPVLFILDGLHEIPDEDAHIRQRLIGFVPFGLTGITAVLTDSVPSRLTLSQNAKVKTWRLSRFTLDETKEYLKDVIPDPKTLAELYQTFKGRPGSLAVIHRMLSAGHSLDSLLVGADGNLSSLLEREWASLGPLSEAELRILGILVFARTALHISDIARVLRLNIADVEALVAKVPFVSRDLATGAVAIVGDTMRQCVVRKTERFKSDLLDALIKDLQDNPRVRESLATLPRYFQDAGRLEELVSYLTPTRLSQSLRDAETLRPLSETLGAGLDAAVKLKRDGDSYRFSLQRSAVAEVGKATSWDAQIDAVLALKDFEQAVQIAESVPLAKEKLLLLASVAAAQRSDGLSPPEPLLHRIRRLMDDVADSLGPEQAVELAGRLFVVLPDRATQLVQSAATSGRPGGTVDRAIAQLTIQATVARSAATEAGGSHTDIGASMRSQIRDPELRRFSSTVSSTLSAVSAADALAQSRTIESARDQIYFLRHWTDRNRQRPDAIEVTQAAIDLIVATTEYAPNARDVLRIARPLRFCNDQHAAMKCVSRLAALLGDLAERGPTAELFRLRILLAATTFRWDRESGRTRFQEEYLAISDITDLAIKAECLARLHSQLCVADKDGYLQAADKLQALTEGDLHRCLEALVACTADHIDVLSPVVAALANTHHAVTERVIGIANTLNRREWLRIHAVEHMLRGPLSRQVLEAAVRLCRAAVTASSRSECVIAMWRELAMRPKELNVEPELIDALASTAFAGRDPRERCLASALAYAAIREAQVSTDGKSLDKLRELLKRSLDEIDDAWEAVDTALKVCAFLAKADVELARQVLTTAQAVQNERLGGRFGPTWLVIAPIKLALGALAGLMRKSCDHATDAARVLSQIKCIPSTALRAQLRAELAVWLYAAERIADCRRVVQDHILPEIRELETQPEGLFTDCVVSAADAIFLARPETAYALFAKLDRESRDLAISRAAAAKLNRLPASEPYRNDEKLGTRLSREDIDELVPLLRMTDGDAVSWGIVDRVMHAVVDSPATTFSAQQQAAIAQQLEAIASETLPRKDWIAHPGYVVLWNAAAKRIKGRKLEHNDPWIGEARKIANVSDRCFVLAHLSGLANADASAKLLDEAAALARTIPVEVERIDRLAYVAEAELRHRRTSGKHLVKEVCRLAQQCDHGDMDQVQRRLMDAAYRMDRELAGSLAEAVDTDPARVSARAKRGTAQLREQLKELEAGSAVMDHVSDASLPPNAAERLPGATWQALASLNAGRSQAKRPEDLRPYIRVAADMPLSQAYPIMSWILANARVKFEATPQAGAVLRPFFEGCIMVAEFSTATAFPTHALRLPKAVESDDPLLVRIGQHREAQETLDRWISENVKTSLMICDPYFGPDDLWVLMSVLRHSPAAKVVVLTSREKRPASVGTLEETFRARWTELSDQDPPATEVIECGFSGSGKLPVHDRWWLSESAGLRLGTSLGGLGSRESRLSVVETAELANDRAMIEDYAARRVRRSADGRMIQYSSFTL
jgi:hypothetical protein